MEAQSGGGGGEVRKIHVIYFLSRKGRVEQPHLIEAHHLSKNGVQLRDVKRWLSELRGKDMPESFAWSYKRRYKTGCIWQDLLDEDLITPISDNEYVLKGSEIPSINLSSAVSDDSVKLEEENSVKLVEEKNSAEKNQEALRISANASTLTKNNSEKTKKKKNDANNPSTPASSTSSSQFTKTSKSYSSNVFRHLCGGSLVTNESAIIINKKNSCYTPSKKPGVEKIAGYRNTAKICKEDKLGGSERVFRTSWLQEQKPHPNARKSCDGLKSSSNNSKPVSAAYKPINGPNCSFENTKELIIIWCRQCGKMFRPHKMNKHMKSCRGMKSLAKSATSASSYEPRKSSMDSTCQESVSGHFLMNGSEFE